MRFVLCLLACTYLSPGQIAPALPAKPKPDRELEDLIQRLASLPPEFEADSLLLLVEAGKIKLESKIATLDRIFLSAGRASVSSPTRGMLENYRWLGESTPALIAQSSASGQDRLVLRLRAVDAMKDLNVEHAAEMFDSIHLPSPTLSCADALMPQPHRYYETLLRLHKALQKSPKPKTREMADDWLTSHFSASHETQITPVAEALAQLTEQKDLFEISLSKFGQDIAKLSPAFRSYWATNKDVTASLIALTKKAQTARYSAEPLWRAYLSYETSVLGGERCADIKAADVTGRLDALKVAVEALPIPIDLKEGFSALAKIEPRRIDDVKPKFPNYRSDPRVAELIDLYRNLRFGPEEKRKEVAAGQRPDGLINFLPLDQRKTPEWQNEAERYLRKLEEYAKLDEEDRVGAFSKTSSEYASLIEITPIGSRQLEACVNAYIGYLAGSPILKEQPLIWLMYFKMFLRRGTLDEHEQGLELVRKLLRERGSHVMNTLVDVDRYDTNHAIL